MISDMNLQITAGSFVSVVGPSGCGKSTLLRLISGLESPTQGEVLLSAKNPGNFSFVFQDSNLLPWRTVYENVHLPFELNHAFRQVPETEQHRRISEALQKVHLLDSQNLFPHQLSGGMKMRVSLARALVNSPRLLLMDEPFAALDENTRFEMQNQLHQLWLQEKMTVVFVTHSLFEASFLAERVIMLKGPGGHVVLDQNLELPRERSEALRTTEGFNRIVAGIAERLRR